MDPMIDPSALVHRLDIASDRATVISVDRDLLRSCAFHDGRETFWNKPAECRPISRLLEVKSRGAMATRYIINSGFCGSTLLSRMLDQPGRSLVLREPQALTDVAAYYGSLQQAGTDDVRFLPILALVHRDLFRPRWDEQEIVIVKSTCWANNLLQLLAADPEARLLFLTIDRYSFVRSVFRGGSARLAFAARLAVHLSSGSSQWARRVAAALAAPGDRLDVIARLTAIAHRIQSEQFLALNDARSSPANSQLTLAELEDDPVGAAERAAAFFGMAPGSAIARTWSGNHAKAACSPYSAQAHAAADRATDRRYGRTINRALDWEDSS